MAASAGLCRLRRRAAHASGNVKTAQGAAMPRSTCSPSGTQRCGGLGGDGARDQHRPAERPAQTLQPADQVDRGADGSEIQAVDRADVAPQHLTEMQRHAERKRRQSLRLPRRIEMGHPGAGGGDGAQRRVAGVGRRAGHREDRQHAVADELQHLAAEGMHRPGDPVEPGVEGGDHRRGRRRLGERGEAAQIGIEQRGADGLAGAAAQRAGLDPRGAAPAEIGFEQRGQRRPRGERGERRRDEARGLAQPAGLGGSERPGAGPAQHGPIGHRNGGRTDRVLLHRAEPGQPFASGLAERTADGKAQRFDHRPGLRPPQPGATGDDRMRHRKRERAAGHRQAVGQQPAAELGQEQVRAKRGACLVNQPGKRRGQIHAAIMWRGALACHLAPRETRTVRKRRRPSVAASHSLPWRPRQGSGPGSRPAATAASRSR